MTNHTPQGLPPHFPHEADREAGEGLEPAYSVSKLHEYAENYAREALAAQAATLESIHKIIECAGPEAADEIADLLGYPSVEWPSDQALTAPNLACKSAQARLATQWGYVRAASVEPVGEVGSMPGTSGFTMACFKAEDVPIGTKLYASAPPTNIPADVEAGQAFYEMSCHAWGITPSWPSLNQDERDRQRHAAKTFLGKQAVAASAPPSPASVPATAVMQVGCENIDGTLNIHPEMGTCSICEPAAAVDAVPYATLQEVDRFFSGRLAELGSLSGEATDLHAYVRAALQASRQPQAQQGGGAAMREALRMGVECLRNQKSLHPEDFDELDERAVALLKAALATKEPK